MKLNTPENRIKHIENELSKSFEYITEMEEKYCWVKNNIEKWNRINEYRRKNNRWFYENIQSCLTQKKIRIDQRLTQIEKWLENKDNHIYNYIYQVK